MANPVDKFLKDSKLWKKEIAALRAIILETKLDEDIKWGKPCYSYQGCNIAIIQPFKNFLAMMFFKGSLLKDTKGLLIDNGPHSQSARRLEFHSVEEITKRAPIIKAYISEAIAIENSGLRVELKKNPEPLPEELEKFFAQNAKLKKAFYALTPGRQRAYILHFSGAKLSSTRQSRIKKLMPHILDGKGINDR